MLGTACKELEEKGYYEVRNTLSGGGTKSRYSKNIFTAEDPHEHREPALTWITEKPHLWRALSTVVNCRFEKGVTGRRHLGANRETKRP